MATPIHFAVFDERGVSADDRVQDYVHTCCGELRAEGRSEGAFEMAEILLPALEQAARVLSDLPACAIEGTRVREAWAAAIKAMASVRTWE